MSRAASLGGNVALAAVADFARGLSLSLSLSLRYLPGALLVLLLQSAIPVSMVLSALFLNERYHVTQYAAAVVVCGGILFILAPSLFGTSDDDDAGSNVPLWGAVLIASCVPMCLSSIYKEKSLGDTDLDPVYLNAWIAVFQVVVPEFMSCIRGK